MRADALLFLLNFIVCALICGQCYAYVKHPDHYKRNWHIASCSLMFLIAAMCGLMPLTLRLSPDVAHILLASALVFSNYAKFGNE